MLQHHNVDFARRQGKVVGVMAEAMIDFQSATGACTEDQLLRVGFTAGEIAEHGDEARAMASRQFVRQLVDTAEEEREARQVQLLESLSAVTAETRKLVATMDDTIALLRAGLAPAPALQ